MKRNMLFKNIFIYLFVLKKHYLYILYTVIYFNSHHSKFFFGLVHEKTKKPTAIYTFNSSKLNLIVYLYSRNDVHSPGPQQHHS